MTLTGLAGIDKYEKKGLELLEEASERGNAQPKVWLAEQLMGIFFVDIRRRD